MSCPNCGAKSGHLGGCSSGAGRKGDKGKGGGRGKRWITITCPTCKGSGKRGDRDCGLCNGKGTIRIPDE